MQAETFHEPLIPETLKWKLLFDIKAEEGTSVACAEIRVKRWAESCVAKRRVAVNLWWLQYCRFMFT